MYGRQAAGGIRQSALGTILHWTFGQYQVVRISKITQSSEISLLWDPKTSQYSVRLPFTSEALQFFLSKEPCPNKYENMCCFLSQCLVPCLVAVFFIWDGQCWLDLPCVQPFHVQQQVLSSLHCCRKAASTTRLLLIWITRSGFASYCLASAFVRSKTGGMWSFFPAWARAVSMPF